MSPFSLDSPIGTLPPGELKFLCSKALERLFQLKGVVDEHGTVTVVDDDHKAKREKGEEKPRVLAEPFVRLLDRDDFPEYYDVVKGVFMRFPSLPFPIGESPSRCQQLLIYLTMVSSRGVTTRVCTHYFGALGAMYARNALPMVPELVPMYTAGCAQTGEPPRFCSPICANSSP